VQVKSGPLAPLSREQGRRSLTPIRAVVVVIGLPSWAAIGTHSGRHHGASEEACGARGKVEAVSDDHRHRTIGVTHTVAAAERKHKGKVEGDSMTPTPWWLASLTALVVAIIGVFQEQIRRALFGPKLDVWFDQESLVDSHLTQLTLTRRIDGQTDEISIPTFWVRLRVANAGRTAAHFVELIAAELWRRKSGESNFARDPKFSPLALKWAHLGKPTLELLAAGLEKHCDLLHIPDPSRTVPEGITSSCSSWWHRTPGRAEERCRLQCLPYGPQTSASCSVG